jgi:hypothetical protein
VCSKGRVFTIVLTNPGPRARPNTIEKDQVMPTSEARIRASQINGSKSKGPISPEGKAVSRRNSLKHGLTGEGVVLPNEDAAEVERRLAAFQEELQPTGEVGRELVRRAEVCSVRMERCVSQETAALSERVRQAEADFVAPEGADEATVAQLKAEAKAKAMFDPSKEATLARKYEAAAERSFFRALKELRQLEKEAKVAEPPPAAEPDSQALGSFLTMRQIDAHLSDLEARMDRREAELARKTGTKPIPPAGFSAPGDAFELPFSIGRPR